MDIILQTPRTCLRKFNQEDAQALYDLNADPEVILYTGDPPFESVSGAASFIENYSDYEQHNCGRWAVIRKEDNQFLGWCGLKYNPAEDLYDIGFRFFKSVWGQGYATETAAACLHYGMHELHISTIYGRAMEANVASIRVLEKLGMQKLGHFEFAAHPGVLYVYNSFGNTDE